MDRRNNPRAEAEAKSLTVHRAFGDQPKSGSFAVVSVDSGQISPFGSLWDRQTPSRSRKRRTGLRRASFKRERPKRSTIQTRLA